MRNWPYGGGKTFLAFDWEEQRGVGRSKFTISGQEVRKCSNFYFIVK